MIRIAALAIVTALTIGGASAYAASGTVTDPKGDYPDIVKLAYSNAASKVTMTLTVAGGHAQNESFYMRWGSKGTSYQVFNSPSASLKQLRYFSKTGAAFKLVTCKGLVVKQPSSATTTVTVPRSCIPKAASALSFQGIATEGTSLLDETKVSKAIKRG